LCKEMFHRLSRYDQTVDSEDLHCGQLEWELVAYLTGTWVE